MTPFQSDSLESRTNFARSVRNGLANSRFHTLLFGINRLRSDELPHCWAKSPCSGAFVQLFVQPEFQRFTLPIDALHHRQLWRVLRIWRPKASQTGHYKRVNQDLELTRPPGPHIMGRIYGPAETVGANQSRP
jgi:hypothetical protein